MPIGVEHIDRTAPTARINTPCANAEAQPHRAACDAGDGDTTTIASAVLG
jgi:hypothetical protein